MGHFIQLFWIHVGCLGDKGDGISSEHSFYFLQQNTAGVTGMGVGQKCGESMLSSGGSPSP